MIVQSFTQRDHRDQFCRVSADIASCGTLHHHGKRQWLRDDGVRRHRLIGERIGANLIVDQSSAWHGGEVREKLVHAGRAAALQKAAEKTRRLGDRDQRQVAGKIARDSARQDDRRDFERELKRQTQRAAAHAGIAAAVTIALPPVWL